MRDTILGRVAAFAALALVLAGCVTETRPDGCDDAETTITVTVDAASMQPTDPSACRGQEVTMVVTPEFDGVFHIHGYDAAVPAQTLTNGAELTFTFMADRSGQFPIEVHPADDPRGVDVGIFTVHEP